MPTHSAPEGGASRSPAGLYLLFDRGNRPRRSDILAALATLSFVSVSHDPASSLGDQSRGIRPVEMDTGCWLELLNCGMTFDLLGLAPGPGAAVPEIAHRLACDAKIDFADMEAIVLVAGPHLADGANSLPVVRAMLETACGLGCALDGVGILSWSPARAAIVKGMFCNSVEAWLAGGAFPALGLTAFRIDEDGLLASEGLSFFIEQELRFSKDLSQDRIAATQLGVRIVHELVGSGPLTEPRDFVTNSGGRFLLDPDVERGHIRVQRM